MITRSFGRTSRSKASGRSVAFAGPVAKAKMAAKAAIQRHKTAQRSMLFS
jgi:hypothetical protein